MNLLRLGVHRMFRLLPAAFALCGALSASAFEAGPDGAAPSGPRDAASTTGGLGDHGAPGYGRVVDAVPVPAGRLDLGLRSTFFQKTPFPTVGRNRLMTGELVIRYGLPRGWDLYGAWRTGSNSNTAALPALVQSQGDVTAGLRWLRTGGGLWRGADMRANLLHPVGGDLWSLKSSQLELRGLAQSGASLRGHPVRFDFNAGLSLGAYARAREERVTPVELLGTGLSGYHRLVAAAGARWELGRQTPYAAVDLGVPLGVSAQALSAAGTSSGAVVARGLLVGDRIALGSGLIDLGVQFGSGDGVEGLAPTPPWTLLASYVWHPDPTSAAPAPRAPPPPEPLSPGLLSLPSTTRHIGIVRDAGSQQPLARVIVALTGRSPVATGTDGRFESPELALGAQTLELSRDGYRSAVFEVTLGSDDKPATYLLEPLPATIPDAATSSCATAADVPSFVAGRFETSDGRPPTGTLRLGGDRSESWPLEAGFHHKLSPGHYTLVALPDAHAARAWAFDVAADAVTVIGGRLEARPAVQGYDLDGEELVARKPLVLDEKSVVPPRANEPLLAELADALLRSSGRRLVVGVHADPPKGGDDDRMEWTRARAEALKAWFIERGVPPERIEAKGFGMTDPVVPSLVKDKSKNRRVSLSLVDASAATDGAAPAEPVRPAAPTVPAAVEPGPAPAASSAPAAVEPVPEFDLPDLPL